MGDSDSSSLEPLPGIDEKYIDVSQLSTAILSVPSPSAISTLQSADRASLIAAIERMMTSASDEDLLRVVQCFSNMGRGTRKEREFAEKMHTCFESLSALRSSPLISEGGHGCCDEYEEEYYYTGSYEYGYSYEYSYCDTDDESTTDPSSREMNDADNSGPQYRDRT